MLVITRKKVKRLSFLNVGLKSLCAKCFLMAELELESKLREKFPSSGKKQNCRSFEWRHSMGSEIIIGDCVDKLKEMESESIDLVVTDPPYNVGINYGFGVKADKRDDYQHWCSVWISECHRVLKKTGSLWVVSGQEYWRGNRLRNPKRRFLLPKPNHLAGAIWCLLPE